MLIFIVIFTGSYQYFEASEMASGTIAKYLSPLVESPTDICLEFWVHMTGDSIGTLELLQMYYNDTLKAARMDTLWKNNGKDNKFCTA